MSAHTFRILPVFVFWILTATSQAGAQPVLYVDDDAATGGNGQTWTTAYQYLQDALAVAAPSGGSINEIRVGQGTYRPDQDEGGSVTPGDREATFQLLNGLALKGGYRGCAGGDCAGDPDERDTQTYETILDGDLLRNDSHSELDAIDAVDDPLRDDNSYHLVTSLNVDETAVLDGFTITAGNANAMFADFFNGRGGGMSNSSSSPTVQDCLFRGNSARFDGAGIKNIYSSPTVTDCTFVGNAGFNQGAAMDNSAGSSPTVANCRFIRNVARNGGAINNADITTQPEFVNCVFTDNRTIFGDGGAILNFNGSPTLINCTFIRNRADGFGGGVISERHTSLTVGNCIFWDNTDHGGANTSESAQIHNHDDAVSVVTYSLVQGLETLTGAGNIDGDPLFVDADGSDDLPGTEDDDLRLSLASPCVDAGDNTAVVEDTGDLDGDGDTTELIPVDLDVSPRFVNDACSENTGNTHPSFPNLGIVDMGAFENPGCRIAYLDIKPGSCPNPLNVRSRGVSPMAVLGSESFDVMLIDIHSLVLTRADSVGGTVSPLIGPRGPRVHIDDAGTGWDGDLCECHGLMDDGFDDLVLKFSTPEVVEVLELGLLSRGEVVGLTVNGLTHDGTSFHASDCIVIRGGPSAPSFRQSGLRREKR